MKQFITLFIAILLATRISNAATNADTSIVVNGAKHPLRVSIPGDYNSSVSYPLVIGLHYCGGNSNEYRNGLKPLCDSLNVIVVCPDNNSQQMTVQDFILASIDTARSIYNIDTASVYLTGMSCNGFTVLQMGLNKIYPFRGIFPWDPWFDSFTSSTFNLDSEIPAVISVGTSDPNYTPILKFYDSLEAHGNNTALVLVSGIGHTLGFSEFSNEMIRCYHYLNDTDAISIDSVPVTNMLNTETTVDIKVKVVHETDAAMNFRAISSNTQLAGNPSVSYNADNDTATITVTPNKAMRDGLFKIVFEAAEAGGTAVEQRIIIVNMQDGPVSGFNDYLENSFEIYPVPAENVVYIKGIDQNISVQIMDINGKKVFSGSNFNTASPVDISNLSSGIYFLRAKGLSFTATVKLIKS